MSNENETTCASMTTATPKIDPLLDTPIEPVRLLAVWREAATELLKQGEPTAAGAFLGCAQMLEAWIAHEGPSVLLCMPSALRTLIHTALHFNRHDRDSWHTLAHAALDCQTGPS